MINNKNLLEVSEEFNRKLVSFQANKTEPIYRWFKYKEGFSSSLVEYFLKKYNSKKLKVLDPFAGCGTTLFTASANSVESIGIELLPVGNFVMEVRKSLSKIDLMEFESYGNMILEKVNKTINYKLHINHIPITKDAFPEDTEIKLNKYLSVIQEIENVDLKNIFKFIPFCFLEEISFTRKDGQYLRWDHRSKRLLKGKPFNKGKILSFEEAYNMKFSQILSDLKGNNLIELFPEYGRPKENSSLVNNIYGSCLNELIKIPDETIGITITSPPYCNRYDYTRSYALELVYLGVNNDEIKILRQNMLSCTVENKEKFNELKNIYSENNSVFEMINNILSKVTSLNQLNTTFESLSKDGKLNNKNISRMIKNYFYELAFVIYEISRVTSKDGYCIMVNDNVKYAGYEVEIDLILSDIANQFNLKTEKIFVLPRGKGNSSQQMGIYGRTEIRKCIYLWRKI